MPASKSVPNSRFASVEPSQLRRLVAGLLGWFAENARDLPWRRTRDPYAVWVSEIMLQQTQVKTVIPYWERWMRALPTLRALAKAKPEKVLKLWEGLGYYTRARNLQKAAQNIVAQHGGRFPETFQDVLALPGVGRYTAGAICSIAFNQPKPILDGNVIRVLTRLFGIREDPREKTANARLWQLAEQFVSCAARFEPTFRSTSNCSLLNQSLMELGALVCTPRQPGCASCVLRSECVARRDGLVEQLPNLALRAASTARHFVAFVVEDQGRFLVRQRPTGVVNAHLWEFPNTEITNGPSDPATAAKERLGLDLSEPQAFLTVKHSITRYRIEQRVYRAQLRQPATSGLPGRWLTARKLTALPFTGAHGKILR